MSIYGNGAMQDYNENNLPPWYEFRELINYIEVGENVTKIGNYSFYYLEKVSELRINSKNLDDLSRDPQDPNMGTNFALYYIGNKVGTRLVFGSEVTKVPSYLTMPYTYGTEKTNIVDVEFEGNKVQRIANFSLAYVKAPILAVPEGVSTVNGLGLGYNDSYQMILPNSLTSPENWAFNGNRKLESLIFGTTLNRVNTNTFSNCSKLKTLVIPHLNETKVYSASVLSATKGHNVVIYGDDSTKEWVNNLISASGQTNLIYKPLSEYKISINSDSILGINETKSYGESYTFTTSNNIRIYYEYIDSSGISHLLKYKDYVKDGNTYTINNIKSNIYIASTELTGLSE